MEFTHRPLSRSFWGLPYRILNIDHKKELLRGLWVTQAKHIMKRLDQDPGREKALAALGRSGTSGSSPQVGEGGGEGGFGSFGCFQA